MQNGTFIRLFIIALFVISKIKNILYVHQQGGWLDKLQYIHKYNAPRKGGTLKKAPRCIGKLKKKKQRTEQKQGI